MFTTHFISNDTDGEPGSQLQTAYFDVGEGDPFVLIHGFTGSKLDFQDQLPWFTGQCRMLAYDQRGHGESSNVGPYTLESLTGDLFGFLDAMGIDQCHLLGHSLGGMVALRGLLAQPGRFKSAVLMDTAPYGMSLFEDKVRAQLNSLVTEQGCAALLNGMQGQPQNAVVQRGMDFLGEREHWRRIRVKLEQMDPQAFVDLGHALTEQASVQAQLSGLTTQVTVMVGEHDKAFTRAAKEMAVALPNAQLVTIKDAGHSPQYENAEAWQTAIEAHLSAAT
jgi:3-oxoadipate enol-lactonase